VKDSENPCCQPTTYAVYCPFHSLAAILYGFTLVCGPQAQRSSGKKEERETLAAILYGFMPFYVLPWRPVKKSTRFLYGFLSFSH
jgi:hypothetical protein